MNKAVFLDRDGTLNEDRNYLFRKEDFRYLPGVTEGLKRLSEMGFLLVIITNQSGIARGYYTEEDYKALNTWMLDDLASKGITIASVYHCPHYIKGTVKKYAVECSCRKPETGLFHRAASELDIDLDASFAVGDRLRDLSITGETGARGILLTEDRVNEEFDTGKIRICRSFSEAVAMIDKWQNE